MGKKTENGQALRNRIVGEGMESPADLLANPQNWRRHPREQLAALEGMLEAVGWVQRVIVNRTTGRMVDGHARVELAIKRGEAAVPVLFVELTRVVPLGWLLTGLALGPALGLWALRPLWRERA
jgi:hypothetical protein